MTMTDTLDRGDLAQLREMLTKAEAMKHDVVVPPTKLEASAGKLVAWGAGPEGVPDDVEALIRGETVATDLVGQPTRHVVGQLADKLAIPGQYLARCHADHVRLFDHNVNGWLERYDKPLLLRSFIDPASERPTIIRAVMSEKGWGLDHLDVFFAGLDAVRATGRTPVITGCSLTEQRFWVQIAFPELAALAPTLLAGYRVPEGVGNGYNFGYGVINDPIVWAGVEYGNSEVGDGASYAVPRMLVPWCTNGMKRMVDISRHVHLGAKLDMGVVNWSAVTQQKNVDLIRSQMTDAIGTFLSQEYLDGAVGDIEAKAGVRIRKPDEVIKVVGKQLAFTKEQQELIFAHFVEGGQMTAGGLLNAVTSAAQLLPGEQSYALENKALAVLDLVRA